MTKLTDTQAVILSAAAQRADRNVLPLPGSLRGGAAAKVVGALLTRGLVAERVTDSLATADPALNRVWRNDADGRAVLLHVTDAGLAAIGVETGDADATFPDAADAPHMAQGAPDVAAAADADAQPPAAEAAPTPAATDAPKPRKTREGTKQAQLIAMLRAEGGATIDEIVAALEWRSHTVRGAMAGALKKKLGLTIASEKVEARGRVYRIPES